MTDVPPGADGPAGDPDPYVPEGLRRSTFTPPAADATPPSFDDDALADALAAQVSSYTAPIAVTPAPQPVSAPATAPVSSEPPATEAPITESPVMASPKVETSSSATLEAIERLESELRRRADEAQAAPVAPAEPPIAEPPTAEPPQAEPPRAEPLQAEQSSSFAPPPVFAPPPAFVPLPPDAHVPPAGERLFPSPFRPFGTAPIPEPAESADIEPPTFTTPEPPSFPAPGARDQAEELPPMWDSAPPPSYTPPPLVEPPSFEPPAFEPPAFEPPAVGAPSFGMPAPAAPVELPSIPPPPGAAAFDAPPPTPGFGVPPLTPPIDLPPPGAAVDLSHLPPPLGLEPAALPPYDPADEVATFGALAPAATDFDSLLDGTPAVHPDDLGPGTAPALDATPYAPPAFDAFAAPVSQPIDLPPPVDDDDDVVDDVDRVFGAAPIAVDSTGAVDIVAPPSQPIPTVRLADDEPALVDEELEHHPALLVEQAGTEPTPHDLRAGRAARLFWLWFAANSSVVSLTIGAVLFGLGMSLRQTLVAILIGVAISFLPLGLVTLAGKWSGQPTMIVSRATFGLAGNALPAVLALVSRVFWGGALLWMLSAGVASILVDAGLDAGLGVPVWTLVGLGAGFLIAFVVAIFGYGLIARLQLILSIVTGVLVVGLIVITAPHLDLAAAQDIADGPWILLVSGTVLVFSFVGLAWVHSSADVARYQRTGSDGGSTMLWATFGATLPAFLMIAWGALLAASDPVLADALAANPVHAIASLLPLWYPAPLLAATALGLLSGVVLTIYSGGFALQSLGIRSRRSFTTVIAGILVLAAGAALVFLVTDARVLVRDVATTIAVPVAAWAGIFVAEMMIRRRGFDSGSLLRRGGIYPAVRWGNVIGLVLITAIGFGLSSAVLPGLDWQGYLLPLLGLPAGDPLLTSDVGVLVALVLGILLPLVSAVPAIRRQERALVDSGS